jgi:Zn-dependent oligopeptidase
MRCNRFLSGPLSTWNDMIQSGHLLEDQMQDRINEVQDKWAMLKEEFAKRRILLKSDAYLFSDCNETDSGSKESPAKSEVNSSVKIHV